MKLLFFFYFHIKKDIYARLRASFLQNHHNFNRSPNLKRIKRPPGISLLQVAGRSFSPYYIYILILSYRNRNTEPTLSECGCLQVFGCFQAMLLRYGAKPVPNRLMYGKVRFSYLLYDNGISSGWLGKCQN